MLREQVQEHVHSSFAAQRTTFWKATPDIVTWLIDQKRADVLDHALMDSLEKGCTDRPEGSGSEQNLAGGAAGGKGVSGKSAAAAAPQQKGTRRRSSDSSGSDAGVGGGAGARRQQMVEMQQQVQDIQVSFPSFSALHRAMLAFVQVRDAAGHFEALCRVLVEG